MENRIKTQFINPPIPIRSHDYVAWVDGNEEGPIGYGETEQEAIDCLSEQLDEELAD